LTKRRSTKPAHNFLCKKAKSFCGVYHSSSSALSIAIYEVELPNAEYGNCQAVSQWRQRLPREFRFGGSQVGVRWMAEGVLLEPLIADPAHWFAELDGLRQGRFLGKSQEPNQPLIANASR
jgi:virulence-associated protein VagC